LGKFLGWPPPLFVKPLKDVARQFGFQSEIYVSLTLPLAGLTLPDHPTFKMRLAPLLNRERRELDERRSSKGGLDHAGPPPTVAPSVVILGVLGVDAAEWDMQLVVRQLAWKR